MSRYREASVLSGASRLSATRALQRKRLHVRARRRHILTRIRGSYQIIPLADPRGDHADLRAEIMAALERTIDSGSYILGKEVEAFEHRLAVRLGAVGAVGVGSGTEALALGLLAVGVSSGDE